MRSVETVCQDVFREILRQSRQFGSRELLVLAHQDVVDRLLGEDSAVLAELETTSGRPIRLQSESLAERLVDTHLACVGEEDGVEIYGLLRWRESRCAFNPRCDSSCPGWCCWQPCRCRPWWSTTRCSS